MPTAGIREVKNNLSRYVRALRPGEVLAITDRGRVVAELRSASGSAHSDTPLTGGYARLVAAGVIRRASEQGDPLEHLTAARDLAAPAGTASALIREDRGA